MMTHRTDIDGLRFFAVMGVIIAHAGGPLPAGHLGVDVFFVISGYLIGTILLKQIQNNSFSYKTFYYKRAKRILPAVVAVSTITAIIAILITTTNEKNDILASIASANLFFGNMYFWLTQDYFAPAGETTPFLHTWSLGIEEQFYVFLPPLLLLLAMKPWKIQSSIFLIFSTASLIGGYFVSSETSFYTLPFRSWELLVGVVAAQIALNNTPKSSKMLSTIGLIIIMTSYILLDKNANSNSALLLMPVGGTLLVLIYGSNTHSPRILFLKPFVHIGLISYSLYLIHQPLFAFTKMLWPGSPTFVQMIPFIALALMFSHLMWKYIEEPFRRSGTPPKSYLTKSGITLTALLIFIITLSQIETGRTEIIAAESSSDVLRDECHLGHRKNTKKSSYGTIPCSTGNVEQLDVALVGDSHSATLFTPLKNLANEKDWNITMETQSGCPVYFHTYEDNQRKECTNHYKAQWEKLSKSKPKVIVVFPRNHTQANNPTKIEHVNNSIQKLLSLGGHVVYVLPVPEPGFEVAQIQWRRHGLGLSMPTTHTYSKEHIELGNRIKEAVQPHNNLHFINPVTEFCSGTKCEITDTEGNALYYDDDHLSLSGGKRVMDLLTPTLTKILGSEQ